MDLLRAAGPYSHVAHDIYIADPVTVPSPPHSVVIGDRVYERFMDYIFVPGPLESLSVEQVIVVNSLRRRLVEEHLIGPADAIVKAKFARLIRRLGASNVLEWGCGFDSLRSRLPPNTSWAGTDIDPTVVAFHRRNGLACYPPNRGLPLVRDRSIDVIPGVFVFQFAVPSQHILEMRRVLRSGGVIVANVYRRSARSRRDLREAMRACGLVIAIEPDQYEICADHEYWAASATRSHGYLAELIRGL